MTPRLRAGVGKRAKPWRRTNAACSRRSRKNRATRAGGDFPKRRHAYRTEFQRDRARIIHARAFRRLEYKTQVFLNGTGDHLRTRLTHTIEVASISRTIARALSLNEDLAEAIALAHDLGHSPFGHSGEEMLAECMQGHGGFEHNEQSLRVVDLLEAVYPDFPGLNLTFEVREGLQKHRKLETRPSLEAQIANLADEITYYSHDLDDAVDFQILSADQLEESAVWRRSHEAVTVRYPDAREPELHQLIIRNIIDVQVTDVIASSAQAIAAAGLASADEARRQEQPLICYSEELLTANRELRRFLIQECLLSSARRGGEPAGVRDVAGGFRSLCARAGFARRRRDEADRDGGIAPDGVRLHRGHDGSLFAGGTRAGGETVAPGDARPRRSRFPRASIGSPGAAARSPTALRGVAVAAGDR